MRTLVEASWAREGELEEGEPAMEKGTYWLLHWALKYEIIQLEEGHVAAVNYTVGICQDFNTGELRCFLPESIKIIGTELKK